MRAAYMLPAAAVVLGCVPNSPVGASGELNAVFAFAAYPRGAVVQSHANPGWVGPYQVPGGSGFQEYAVTDPPATVEAHYRDLATRNGWTMTGAFQEAVAFGEWTLAREKRSIRLTLSPHQGPAWSGYGPGYATAPTPTPSTWYLRVEANL